jgi:hypothetical protein
LLQCKLHLVLDKKKRNLWQNELGSFILRRISCSISSKLYFLFLRKNFFYQGSLMSLILLVDNCLKLILLYKHCMH